MKNILCVLLVLVMLAMIGCTDAELTSHNLSKAADQFEVYRRVVFINGITNDLILQVEGYSSIRAIHNQLELTVKTDSGKYLKHLLGLSDNVTYFVEQIDPAAVSAARYRFIFKPSAIVPNIDME